MSPRRDPSGRSVTLLLVLLTALGPISTDLYLPSLPAMQRAFDAETGAIQLTLSVYMIAFAAAQLIYGPLSDRFGRRGPLLAGTGLYVAASILCLVAPSIEWLILGRFLQGVGGCAGQVIARAVVRDVHGRERAGPVLAKIAFAMGFAPAVGPAIGGLLTDAFGWQACFWALTLAGAAALLGSILLLEETNRHPDPDPAGARRMVRIFASLLRHRQFSGFALAATFSYAGLFAWISGSSFVFIEIFGLAPDLYGYCFASVVIGFMAGAQIASRLSVGPVRAVMIGAAVNAAAGLAMLGLVLAGQAAILTILIPMILYMVGMGIVLPSAQAGAVGPFPRRAGAASSLIGAAQYGVAAFVGLAVGHGFDLTPLPMTLGIAGSGAAALIAWLWLIRGAPDPAALEGAEDGSP
ncbi:MAG: multidrug effflux MFS transporter [Marivibrio sp.]|uniref:multidrug effflux MFS transporter n=1 Tax=Marivibrio sp. TaxID=2039719 RepID=UPI0032EAA6A0